ncbi:MAG: ATP-binding protein, partial [Methanoculleus sp.]
QGMSVALMTDRMQESGIFRRLPGGEYAFAHPLLQEHCRRELSTGARTALNARAADCFERTMHRLSGRLHVLLSLACHFFNAQEYGKAADLNLELGLRFYHREDYDTALVLTQRAVTSAEHIGDDALLAAARQQRDLIRQNIAGPVEAVR